MTVPLQRRPVRRIGAALAGVDRDAFTLSTKVGRLIVPRRGGDTGNFADAPPSDAVFDFSAGGILADPRPGARYGYVPADPEMLERARGLAATCERHGVSSRAAALQFPLRHPAVTSVLAGARSVRELDDCLTQMACDVPAELWAELGA